MKRYKLRKYQMPRMVQANVEPEGIFCQSMPIGTSLDELENVNKRSAAGPGVLADDAEPMYFEF